MDVDEFRGRRVMIVGADEGLGPATVDAFARLGARMVLDAETPPPGARGIALDVTSGDSIRAFFEAGVAELGGLDVFIAAARPVATGQILDQTEAQIRAVVDQELVGVMLCLQEAARRMVPAGKGRIISFASMSGKTGVHTGVGPYAAAKGGLITFSRVLAAELAPKGVTVNVIATALFEPQVAAMDEKHRTELAQAIPVRRFGKPSEGVHAVLYLASDAAGYVTGETLNLSGGRFMD
jgi:NAD(P)-dependent dehydrogenase (short-subunit alcohol dehydrogenase family)